MATLQAKGFPPYVEPCSPEKVKSINYLDLKDKARHKKWQSGQITLSLLKSLKKQNNFF